MGKVNQDPFSNGTDFAYWVERNCERCKKSYQGDDFTKFRCAIERDIYTRMFSSESISQRTIDICAKANCPYRRERQQELAKSSAAR